MPYDNIKSHKKSGFHPLFRGYIFRKTTRGAGGQIEQPAMRLSQKQILRIFVKIVSQFLLMSSLGFIFCE